MILCGTVSRLFLQFNVHDMSDIDFFVFPADGGSRVLVASERGGAGGIPMP